MLATSAASAVSEADPVTAAATDFGIDDVGGHLGRTVEVAVTKPPGWEELAWDAALAGAALVGAVSPPAAIASAAVNRVIHATR